MAFDGQQVFGGPEDRLDALADRGQAQSRAGFVLSAWTHDRDVKGCCCVFELAPGIPLVAQGGEMAGSLHAGEHGERDLALTDFGLTSDSARGVPSGANNAWRRNPKNRRVWLGQYP